MEIIGEKINGTLKSVAKAVADRDGDFIKDLAKRQADAGASWIDINAGTTPDREADDLVWLVNLVQEATDVPICLDSANPKALSVVIEAVKETAMINSISMEPGRCDEVLEIVAKHNCKVIALAIDEGGIPVDVENRLRIIRDLMAATKKAGVPDSDVYIDTLILAAATNTESGQIAMQSMQQTLAEFPEVHLTGGLSNISFGLPRRALLNRVFMALAMSAGLDSAITDPLDKRLMEAILTAETILGKDDYCMNFTSAFRDGRIGKEEL
jgi:5-methyltetrahydrofolate corrinoid/iron sulfur protein methyltransferase